jgi:hypothetical protein
MAAVKRLGNMRNMRLKLITATCLLALGLFTTAGAVEISQDGANAVRDNLTKLLSKELAKSGLVTVNPAGTRYEIIYDLAKLFARADPATTSINGSTSLSTVCHAARQRALEHRG